MSDKPKIVDISGPPVTPPDIFDRLAEAVDHCRVNAVSNCLIITVSEDGQVTDSWASGDRPFTMVGAMETVKRDFMDKHIEKRFYQ